MTSESSYTLFRPHRICSSWHLYEPVLRHGERLEERGDGVGAELVALEVERLEGAVLLQGQAEGRHGEVVDLAVDQAQLRQLRVLPQAVEQLADLVERTSKWWCAQSLRA